MWHFLIPQSAKLAFKVKKKFRFFIFIWFEKFCDQTLDCILIMILHQINQGLHFVLTLPFLNKTVILLLNNKKRVQDIVFLVMRKKSIDIHWWLVIWICLSCLSFCRSERDGVSPLKHSKLENKASVQRIPDVMSSTSTIAAASAFHITDVYNSRFTFVNIFTYLSRIKNSYSCSNIRYVINVYNSRFIFVNILT